MAPQYGCDMARVIVSRRLVLLAMLVPLGGCERLITKPSLYGTVTAEVARRNGTPIAGTRLVLYMGQRPMGYGTSDSLGRYRFDDVPEGAYGVLAVPPAGYVRLESLLATTKPSEVVDQLDVRGEQTLAARFVFLKTGAGSIEAQVREPDGTGIAGVTTVLYDPRGEVRRVRTDSTGRAAFSAVPFGLYGVAVDRPAAYRDSGEVAFPFVDGLLMEDGAAARAPFLFEKCLGGVAIQVVDQQGRAVPGAHLVFYDAAGVRSRDVASASGTRTYAGLACTEYGVRVVVPRGYTVTETRGSAFVDGVRVRRNVVRAELLRVNRIARGTVQIAVVDQDGRAVPNVRTVLYTGQGLERDERTAADGTLTLADIIADSEYGVRVVPPEGYLAEDARGVTFEDGVRFTDGEVRRFTFRFQRRQP